MHIDVVPNRNSRPAYLLRESYREGKAVRKRTLANLSSLSDEQLLAIRAILQGQRLYPVEALFEVTESRAQGHVEAVRVAMSAVGLPALVASRPSPERDRVLAMIAARILAPHTKLATTRWWHTTTLAQDFGVADADEKDLSAAMDWLLEHQDAIQKKLASRHLASGSLVLYDLSSSYFEGTTCPLGKLGYNRDGKKGLLQVNYGLLTDVRGCPVAVSVHEGNTADPQTLLPQVHQLRQDFGIEQLVMIGDRGMISQKSIDELRQTEGIGWITALKSASIRTLVEQGNVQLGLFDQRNLFEFSHPDYPGERLVACRSPELAKLRAHKHEDLLQATEKNQEKVRNYIIRTSVAATQMESADCVRHYKALANVERAFRTMKTIDLKIRPIHHRLAGRVRAHIFLCMLAYYVEWHMRQAWCELMFAHEDQSAKAARDPVAPAKRSAAAADKAQTHTLDDGTHAHSFSTLLAEMSTIVRNTCRAPNVADRSQTFQITTTSNPKQQRAIELLQQITV